MTSQREAKVKARLLEAQEKQRDLWYELVGIPGMFGLKKFSDFDRKLQPRAFDAIEGYDGQSLVLLSPGIYGVGKTHLVCSLCLKLLEEKQAARYYPGQDSVILHVRCPVLFISEGKMLSRIRQSFNHGEGQETEEHIFESLLQVPLLIIDDVGKVRPRDNSFLQGVYYRVIDDRYTNEVPIILTTNLSLQELEEHIGGASADRLREMCGKSGFIIMTGKSYRKGAK